MISIRSSESKPSSRIELSSVRCVARSLAMRRTCSKTIFTVASETGVRPAAADSVAASSRPRAATPSWPFDAFGGARGKLLGAPARSLRQSAPRRAIGRRCRACRPRKPCLQAWRWILPLEVLGMLPALISAIASTGSSCSAETCRRIASKISSKPCVSRCRSRSISLHDHEPLAAARLDGHRRAAAARKLGWHCSTVRSMSCG